MGKIQIWGSRAIVLGALVFVAWLGLPRQPSSGVWPSASETEGLLKPLLVADVGQAWTKQEYRRAWDAASLIGQMFPHSPEASRLAEVSVRLEALSQQEQLAQKWHYKVVSSPGWGTLNEAQIASEKSRFSPDETASFLLLRTGDLARYRAVFLVPGRALPEQCADRAGCILQMEHQHGRSSVRWLPLEGQEGWWQASNPEQTLGWLTQKIPLSVVWPGQEEPLRFETSELDLGKMGLQASP